MDENRIRQLEQIGGSRWQKGEHDRVYINSLGQWYGIDTSRYGTGNISSATLDGERISNGQAKKLLGYLAYAKLWWDVKAERWSVKTLDYEMEQVSKMVREVIVPRIELAIEAEA